MTWTEAELGYLAGLIDGEGCVGVYPSKAEYGHRQKQPRVVYRPRISIANTDRRALDWVAHRFGGHVLQKSRRAMREHWKTSYAWHLQGSNNVLCVLRAVRPFLIIKSAQADLLLTWPANAICNQWTTTKTAEIQGQKQRLYLASLELNRRGRDAVATV
jgi:hypothetical protein